MHASVFSIILASALLNVRATSDQLCPKNTAVRAGDSFQIVFETIKSFYFVNWLEYTTAINGRTVFLNGTNVYNNKTTADRYGLSLQGPGDNDTNVFHTFYVNESVLSDGGKYCAQEFIDSVFHWADVIVLGRDIDCQFVNLNSTSAELFFTTGDVIKVTCTLPFQGKWAPVFACSGTNFYDFTAENSTMDGFASYSFTGATRIGSPTGSVTCETLFLNPTPDEYLPGYAENIAEIDSTWTSPSLDIYYPATEMSITPVMAAYEVGDVVKCIATLGNPSPTYKWLKVNTTDVLSTSSFLRFDKVMAGSTVDAVCLADTYIRGKSHEISMAMSFIVNEVPTTTEPPVTTTPDSTTKTGAQNGDNNSTLIDNAVLIIIIVSVIAGLLAIALIVVLTVFCMKKVTKDSTERI